MRYAAWLATGARRSLGDRWIFVRAGAGPGPWLTLLHGFPTSSHDWAAVWPLLESRWRPLALDFLGFGDSDKPDRPYRLVEQADLVEALWRAEGVEETALVAHDYGVSVAQELLARAREGRLAVRLRRVTLLNGGLWPDLHRPLLVQRLLRSPLGPLVGRLATRRTFAAGLGRVIARPLSTEEIDDAWEAWSRRGGRAIGHRLIRYIDERRANEARWVGALEQAPVPLAFVWGLRDPVSGAHVVPRIEARLPAATRTILPEAGHYPQLEAPGAVAAALLAGP